MALYAEFDGFIELTNDYDIIKLPTGEYVTLAEIYKKISPVEYEKHFQRWRSFDLTLEEIAVLDLHNLM